MLRQPCLLRSNEWKIKKFPNDVYKNFYLFKMVDEVMNK